jgi:glycosyltransferase involved in cell wall biosynthesis
MKIALVTEHGSQLAWGRGTNVATQPESEALRVSVLARTLAELGHLVTIYARRDSPALPRQAAVISGVRVENVQAGPAATLPHDKRLAHLAAFSGELAQRWQRQTPDVVHAHFWTSGLAALAATRGLPVPVVQTFHSLGATAGRPGSGPADGQAAQVKLVSLIARTVRTVLATSSGELADLAGLGVPRTSIRVVPNGVDTTAFSPAGPVARRSRRPRLMVVTPLSDQRQLDTVVRALALIPRAELLIAGGPPRAGLAADPGYQNLTRLAEQAGVSDRVVCTGQVSRARMPALLRSADLLVHVPAAKTPGMVPLEAMACGTPVIASADSSHSDAVIEGATGALIPPDNPVVLARMIRRLLNSPMLLEGYGIAAADRVRARYSWQRVGLQTLSAYERSLQPRVSLARAATDASE